MIKNTLILFSFISLIYFIILKWFPPGLTIPEAPWFKNDLKVSELRSIEDSRPDLVITGSSYSNILDLSKVDGETINLAFGGHTSLDGIKLLKHHHIIPKKLLIEVNYANFDTTGWADNLISGKPQMLRREYKNRPVVYLTGIAADLVNYNYIPNSRGGLYIDSAYVLRCIHDIQDTAIQNNFIKDLDGYVKAMKMELQFFHDEQTEVIFFLMPFNPQLCDEPFFDKIRKAYTNAFNSPGYKFLFYPDCSPYFTFDGRHLTSAEGLIFLDKLLPQVGE
ncbi:MAG: hypothetical protein ACHQFW_02235 [Chitinophagales bacterium]